MEDVPEHANVTAAALPFKALKSVMVSRRSQPCTEDLEFVLKCLRDRKEHGCNGCRLKEFYFTDTATEDPKSQLYAFKGMMGFHDAYCVVCSK